MQAQAEDTNALTAMLDAAETAVTLADLERRNGHPEYTLVRDPYVGIGVYARHHGLTWNFIRVHDGDDVQGLSRALEDAGAVVNIYTNIYDLALQGTFEPTVTVFRHSPPSVRHAAEAAHLYREADRVEALWEAEDRWGDSGATRMRIEAGYAVARLKELNSTYAFSIPKSSQAKRALSRPVRS